jgi:hypothetical protein
MTLLQQNQEFMNFERCSRQSAHVPHPCSALAGLWVSVIATPPRPSETRGGGGVALPQHVRGHLKVCGGLLQRNLVLPTP